MTREALQEIKTKTEPIFRKYGVVRAGVFGSFARGEAKKNSDIDFLVTFPPGTSLFDLGGLKVDLERKLANPVDIVSAGGIKRSFKEIIDKDLTNLYEKKR